MYFNNIGGGCIISIVRKTKTNKNKQKQTKTKTRAERQKENEVLVWKMLLK